MSIRNYAYVKHQACPGFSSGAGSASGASAGVSSSSGSAASLNFIAPTNSPVNKPPLNIVFRKNCQVSGQPAVPLVRAMSHPIKVFEYSGFLKGLKNQD